MKRLFLTLGLAAITAIGWGQVDSTILIDENFNIPILGQGNYNIITTNSNGCSATFELVNTYDNTPCLKLSECNSNWDGDHIITFPAITSIYDSIYISLDYRYEVAMTHSGYGIPSFQLKLHMSPDSSNWYLVNSLPGNTEWGEFQHTISWQNSSPVYFKITKVSDGDSYNGDAFIDNFQVVGYPSEPIIEEPLTCDTVYIEQPPIVIYETDIPQECLLDSDGDGAIGVSDLMNLLLYFGGTSPCDIWTPNSPPGVRKEELIDIPYYDVTHNKNILKVINTSGKEVPPNTKGLLLYIYEDGTVEKRMNLLN
jgi:hypothetical protein